MTLPSLIQKQQKKEITVGLQKMYTTLNQAAMRYQADHDIYITDFDTSLSAKEFMEMYFNPYLNISRECDSAADCWKGGRIPKTIDGKLNIISQYGVILSNGSILCCVHVSGGVLFIFDVDGYRGHNRSGHDIFYFYLINTSALGEYPGCENIMMTLKSGIYPGGYSACFKPFTEYPREKLLGTSIHRACNKNAPEIGVINGDACAALIMMDGWEIKEDYPW